MPFILSHIGGIREVAKLLHIDTMSREYALAVLGSILPDLEYAGVLKGAHSRAREFLEFVIETDKRTVPLAIGMLCHSVQDQILEPSYVKTREGEARRILEEYYPGSALAKLGAHTFVEQAMDTLLVREDPALAGTVDKAWKRISEKDIETGVSLLARFFGDRQEKLGAIIASVRRVRVESLAHSGGISRLWVHCIAALSEEHVMKEHSPSLLAKVTSAIRFGTRLSLLTVAHGTFHFRQMMRKAQQAVTDASGEQAKAMITLRKRFQRLVPKLRGVVGTANLYKPLPPANMRSQR